MLAVVGTPASQAQAPVLPSPTAVTNLPWGKVEIDAGGFRFAVGALSPVTADVRSPAAIDARPGFTHLLISIAVENLQQDRRARAPDLRVEMRIPEASIPGGCDQLGSPESGSLDLPGLCALSLLPQSSFYRPYGEAIYARTYEASEAVWQAFGTLKDVIDPRSLQTTDVQVWIYQALQVGPAIQLPVPRNVGEVEKFLPNATGNRGAGATSSVPSTSATPVQPSLGGPGGTVHPGGSRTIGDRMSDGAAHGGVGLLAGVVGGCAGGAALGALAGSPFFVVGAVPGAGAGCVGGAITAGIAGLIAGAADGFVFD